MKHTPAQEEAIQARGNVLVVAGAGTGKTRTLIDRCMAQLLDRGQQIDLLEILMVTFTEAAATEMRERIAHRLEQSLETDPQNPDLQEKLAQIDAASIGTLHSFCLNLILQHFHLLELDPQARVLEPEEISNLEQQTLDELLDQHYEGQDDFSESVRRYVTEFENGWDKGLREWIIKIHRFSQSLVDPDGWFDRQIYTLIQDQPTLWKGWMVEEIKSWSEEWTPTLESLPEENTNGKSCLEILQVFKRSDQSFEDLAICVNALKERDQKECWPPRCKTRHRQPIEKLLDDAAFLSTLCPTSHETIDPLTEDWTWYRERARTLLELSRSFSSQFKLRKMERGGLDFSDLEQYTLSLLWDRKNHQETQLAQTIQEQFKYVYVDEYQDINAAQDCILSSISRKGSEANRFLVGDVKQSIYGFRLANPKFFTQYEKVWQASIKQETRQVIHLRENFRSRPGILNFVNQCFSQLMKPGQYSQGYHEASHLLFGAPENRENLFQLENHSVECRFIKNSSSRKRSLDFDSESSDLSDVEKEALAIALRLRDLKESKHQILDPSTNEFRPVTWDDMAILMRSVKSKAEVYAKVFSQLDIPLEVPRSGMLDRTEITDLVSLLMLLDNPRQDIALLAVLRSPLVGLTDNELSLIRIGSKKTHFWKALNNFTELDFSSILPDDLIHHPMAKSAKDKSLQFLNQFRTWRQAGRHLNLSRRLESILNDTLYIEKLSANETGGAQEILHVQQLIQLTRKFDHYQQQGLNRFLQFIQNKRELEAEFEQGTLQDGQAVRLMSIHKSKGLEFPVVAVTGLGNAFNLQDVQQTWLLDESMGLSGMIQPPGPRSRYPSLPLWISRRRRKSESMQEELRLLYVAFTRARDHLILMGSASEKRMKDWSEQSTKTGTDAIPRQAHSAMDWLFPWLCEYLPDQDWWQQSTGADQGIDWHILESISAKKLKEAPDEVSDPNKKDISHTWLNSWIQRAEWSYPYQEASLHPAKATVTSLRKRFLADHSDTESVAWFYERTTSAKSFDKPNTPNIAANERGTLHHHFLQWLDLSQPMTQEKLKNQLDQMIESGQLDPEARQALDLSSIADFWGSRVGRNILENQNQVHRELPFTARFSLEELMELQLANFSKKITNEDFVVIQGVVDVAVLGKDSIFILDYKTDRMDDSSLPSKLQQYRPQLELYAKALQRIYQRPVTHKWLHFLSIHQTIEVT